MNAFMQSKKEKAIAERQTIKETSKVYGMIDSVSNAIQTYEETQKIDTSNANVVCTVPIPNLLKTWFAKGNSIAFIPNRYRETDGKTRLLSNLENEIDTTCRKIKSCYNRKVVFTWNVKPSSENAKITSEDVVKAYFKGENPTLKIHFMYSEYKGKRYGFSEEKDENPKMIEINENFSF